MNQALHRPFRGWQALLVVTVCAGILGLAGCAEKPRSAQGKLDTPDHHVLRGYDLMEQSRWGDAEREFGLALSLDKDYGPAMSGMAIIKAQQASVANSSHDRLTDQAMDLADKGLSRAKDDDSKRAARVAFIRVYTYTQSPDSWLKKCENELEKAKDLDKRQSDPDPDFFMARAYRTAFEWSKSMASYSAVLAMGRGRQQQANDEFAVVQKIVRAAPGSMHGKLIAIQPALSRADVAALLIEEMQIGKLYERAASPQQRFNTGFQAPTQPGGQMQVDTMQTLPEATDIANHPLRADIEEVMRLRVKGLEPLADRQFHANDPFTRAEYAIMIVDVMEKVTGRPSGSSKFFGENPSSIPDMSSNAFSYGAVKVVLTRNLMEPKNKIQGTFGPVDPVSGADALLAIRELRNELQSVLR